MLTAPVRSSAPAHPRALGGRCQGERTRTCGRGPDVVPIVRLFALLLLAALAAGAPPAAAKGEIALSPRAAAPGEQVVVRGDDWLTCCPPRTPVGRVELFLLADGKRHRLVRAHPDDDGAIEAAFQVPRQPPRSYRLEACSSGPDLPGVAPGTTCVPVEEELVVLAAAARPADAIVGSLLLLGLVAATLVLRRRRELRASPPGRRYDLH
jgi:hypothetical protein